MNEDLNTKKNIDDKLQEDTSETIEQGQAEKPKKDKTIKIKQSEYDELIAKAAEFKDKYVRLYAEFDNARKRMEREKFDYVKYANEGILGEFLIILDSLELSLYSAKEKHSDAQALLKGLEMVVSQMHDVLRRNDVKVIEAKGKKFDHNCHEVLMQEETNDVEEDVVIEEFQKGYYFGERVLRTAKVKLAKPKSEEVKEQN